MSGLYTRVTYTEAVEGWQMTPTQMLMPFSMNMWWNAYRCIRVQSRL